MSVRSYSKDIVQLHVSVGPRTLMCILVPAFPQVSLLQVIWGNQLSEDSIRLQAVPGAAVHEHCASYFTDQVH